LEHHLVEETIGHHLVHFFLKLQQLIYELDRIFDVVFVLDDARATLGDVGCHLVNHLIKSCFVALEHLKQELKLVQLAIFEEVVDASILVDNGLGHISD